MLEVKTGPLLPGRDQRFRRSARLTKTDEFSSVFAFRRVLRATHLNLHYQPCGSASGRLGVVVSKKIARRAHDRNYMKRIIREYFRIHVRAFVGYQVVIRVSACFAPADFTAVTAEFAALAAKLNALARP